eukprot:TRINITY_DN68306_c0_g1_i1.p2 TRINITY_DN68306_c0_g1~~TRINITY_DN68306_c0_g1_i1.p2  ORF type:complete len:306 (+),score=65.07 TRINITY_DN68306_c0_g1_i1:298-1215(+)
MVETSGPPVPEVGADGPVGRADDLLGSPMEAVLGHQALLDVVADEDVLEVVCRDAEGDEGGKESELCTVEVHGEGDVEQEEGDLEAQQQHPVGSGGVELLRAHSAGEEVEDIGDVPLGSADGHRDDGARGLDAVVPLPRQTGVEAEVGVGDGAVVVGPELVGSEVVSDGVLVSPDLRRAADEVHDLLDDGVDVLVAGDGAVVAHVHEEAKTSGENTDEESPPVRALHGDLDGGVQVQEDGECNLTDGDGLVEVAAPADLAQLGVATVADGDEEGVIRLLRGVLQVTDVELLQGQKGLLLRVRGVV